MNRLLSITLFIVAGCLLSGCSSETQNPVSNSTATTKGGLTALHKVISAPTNVLVVLSGFSAIITWDTVAGVNSYHVIVLANGLPYVNVIQTATQLVLVAIPVGSYSVTVAGIATGTPEGNISTPVLFNTIPDPKNVTAVVSRSTVTISWDSAANISRYHIVILNGTSIYLNDTMQVSRQIVLTNVPAGIYKVTIAGIIVLPTGTSVEGTVSMPVLFTVSSAAAPTVTVTASPIPLCARNGKWVIVNFTGVVTNSEGGAKYELKDEYRKIHYKGSVAAGPYSVKLKLKDRRKGYDKDGRQYTFTITTTNSAGSATAFVVVTVPREKKPRNWNDDDDNDDDDDDWGNH